MPESKCPVCGCKKFYVKHPDDAYETYTFACRESVIRLDAQSDAGDCPQIADGTETYCDACTWHDKFAKIK